MKSNIYLSCSPSASILLSVIAFQDKRTKLVYVHDINIEQMHCVLLEKIEAFEMLLCFTVSKEYLQVKLSFI